MREVVLPTRSVGPGSDLPSAVSNFRRPAAVWVRVRIVTGPGFHPRLNRDATPAFAVKQLQTAAG